MADATQAAPLSNLDSPSQRQRIAPLWHTILLLAVIFSVSAVGYVNTRKSGAIPQARMFTYVTTLILEWVLFTYVYLGEKLSRGTRAAQRIGGRWATMGDFGIDIAVAFGVWIAFLTIGGTLNFLLKPAGTKVVAALVPHSLPELAVWIVLSATAGFCEEYVFRGYLQAQFRAITGSVWAAVVIQAIVFGIGHGYQGITEMAIIFVYGLLFGSVAAVRKSLRPTMLAHGWADTFSGIGGYALHLLHRI